MSTVSGLQIAQEMAQTKRDAAVLQLAQTRQLWVAAQVQLDQLENYAQECTTRWSTQSARCTPDLMRHHYQFMERLTHAIVLQTSVVAEHGRSVVRDAGVLREAEGRLESLRQLCFTRERESQRVQDRREQKTTDEHAAQQHRRRWSDQLGLNLR